MMENTLKLDQMSSDMRVAYNQSSDDVLLQAACKQRWQNTEYVKLETASYFEEMKNTLIHNCIGSHTNCFM